MSTMHMILEHVYLYVCVAFCRYGTVHRKLYDNYVCRLTLSPICLFLRPFQQLRNTLTGTHIHTYIQLAVEMGLDK